MSVQMLFKTSPCLNLGTFWTQVTEIKQKNTNFVAFHKTVFGLFSECPNDCINTK